jgi:hypothetical protein
MAKWCTVLTALFLFIAAAHSGQIPIANNSFEIPAIDPIENPFLAVPYAPSWTEMDLDTEYSTNTGIFRNPPPDSPYGDYIVNADGNQLAFLGSQSGNGFLQDLGATYQTGKSYRLTVEVCPSVRFPPSPGNQLILSLYYINDANSVDIQTSPVPSTELIVNVLKTFSVTMPAVQSGDAWVGKNIGIAIRADGLPGGYWDLDNVRLMEFQTLPDFTNDSFVNLQDFAVMAPEWLSCTDVATDLTGDGCVDTEDLLILAEHWLSYV